MVYLWYHMTNIRQMIIDLSELIVTVYISIALTNGTVGIALLIMMALGGDI